MLGEPLAIVPLAFGVPGDPLRLGRRGGVVGLRGAHAEAVHAPERLHAGVAHGGPPVHDLE